MAPKRTINNAFYDSLHELWHEGISHPIALLRAENTLRNPWIASILGKRFEKKCKILDIGCGGGLLTSALAKQGHEVFGIDPSASSIEIAKGRAAHVNYTVGNGQQLPFEGHSFDAVCAMDLLEHVENPEKIISEASRVLKEGGLFFFHTFNRTLLSWLFAVKGVEWCVANTPKQMHLYRLFLKPKEVTQICSGYGLNVEKMMGVSPDMKSFPFWKMLFTRKVYPDFRFVFTPSLKMGYSGYASRLKT
jgi:2-polyprenyl-6-hydroxyphenyl methylase / 3-demethylubiquinone-9 3-methyltransferase